jgi:transcriptional regulator with XRE-family HTH domain
VIERRSSAEEEIHEAPDLVMRDVGRRIAEVRRSRHWTQEEAAERLGMPLKNLQRIERGLQNLTIRTLVRVASTFGVRTADLFTPPVSREVRKGRPPKGMK